MEPVSPSALVRPEPGPHASPIPADAGTPLTHTDAGSRNLGDAAIPSIATHSDPAVQAALRAWREAFVEGRVDDPDSSDCGRRFASLEIVIPDDETFRVMCQRCNQTDPSDRCERIGRINACASWDEPATIVLDATRVRSERTRNALVIHETVHHLSICTRTGGDPDHANDGWWCAQPSCIEGRAWQLFNDA